MSAVTASSQRHESIERQVRGRNLLDQLGRVALPAMLVLTAAVYVAVPLQALGWFRQAFTGVPLALPQTLFGPAPPGGVLTGQILGLFLLPYLSGLVFLALGLAVYRSQRQSAVGYTFLALCASVALALGTTFDLWTAQAFARLWMASVSLAAGLLLVFAIVFPSAPAFVARRPALRWLPLLPALAVLAAAQTRLQLPREQVIEAWPVQTLFVALAAGLFLASLLARSVLAASPRAREQSRLALAGAVLASVPLGLWAFGLVAIPFGWVAITLTLFPAVLAYSIIQARLIDAGSMVRFASVYATIAAIVTAGYALLVAGLNIITNALLGRAISATSPLLVGLLTFALVVGFQPLRQLIHNLLSARLFRSRSEHHDRLARFRHQLTLASGLGEVVRVLKEQIREGLIPTHTYVFLRDPHTGHFVAAGEGSRPDTDIRFEAHSGLVHALSTAQDAIFLEFNQPLPPELTDEHARLAVLRTPLLFPLQGQDRLAGWIAVGGKRSGEPFTARDLRFVQGLAEQASLAVERAQVIGDLERHVRELDVLSQVAQAVNFTTDPDALLELIYAQASKLIDTTNFYIVMHNPEIGGLRYAFFLEGGRRRERLEGGHWPDDEGLAAEVVRTGRPIRTDDYTAECQRRGVTPRQERTYAWMGVPLNAGARTLGVMAVASFTQDVIFTEDQLKVFWAIADQAATALDKARLFNETETRARQLATLNEISKELASTLALEDLLGRIMRAAVDLIGTESGSLLLVDETTGELVFRVVEGGAQDLIGTSLPVGVGVVGEAVEGRQPIIVNDVLQERRWFTSHNDQTDPDSQSLLAVPMLLQDQSIGALEVINRRDGLPFASEDATLLTTFAAQAAVAIENARLYEATDAELTRRVDELQVLQRIDRDLNRTLQLDRVAHITLDWAMRLTGASAGLVGILNPEGNGLHVLARSGCDGPSVAAHKDAPFPLGQGIAGRVVQNAQPEFVEVVSGNPDLYPLGQAQAAAAIAVPILRAGQPVGALVLESDTPGRLNHQAFDFAQRLVEHAAVAIENARLVEEVQDANRSKTEFVSFVAHELKNPMTSIRGYTDLLKSGAAGPLNEMQDQFLGTVRSNVDRMTRLVSDLADAARLETGQLRLDMAPVSVPLVVEETLNALQAQIEEKRQQLVVAVPGDLPEVWADHTRMVQVLTNLVSNAHKYTPEEGTLWVGARVEQAMDEAAGQPRAVVHHWVRDTGIGLSPDDLERLFVKFFRAERGKQMAQGTGLGLNITRSLVEQHGGSIWVESEVGAGSTFHFTIPVCTGEESQSD